MKKIFFHPQIDKWMHPLFIPEMNTGPHFGNLLRFCGPWTILVRTGTSAIRLCSGAIVAADKYIASISPSLPSRSIAHRNPQERPFPSTTSTSAYYFNFRLTAERGAAICAFGMAEKIRRSAIETCAAEERNALGASSLPRLMKPPRKEVVVLAPVLTRHPRWNSRSTL